MPKKLDTFEYPHGGRKGMDVDFRDLTGDGTVDLLDGSNWQLERGVDWPMEITADTFLGGLSRAANAQGLRVNKHVSEDKNTVTIRCRPKKTKTEAEETPKPKTASAKK